MRFLILALLFLSPAAMAAEADQTMIGDTEILRGHFTEQRHLQGFTGPLNAQGHFVVAPHLGLIWAVEKPFPTTTIITPAGLVQNVNGNAVMRLPSQKIPFMQHLYDTLGGALTGNWAALQSDFTVVRQGDAQNWQVTLTPIQSDNPAMPFSVITINGHRFVDTVVMQKPDGDSDNLVFSNEMISDVSTAAEKRAFASVQP